MKKLATLMTAVVLVMMSATMVSCGESDDYDYYFDLDRALTEYFNRYGDFGTDDRTTADWFDHYYPYASDYDYRSFINAVNADINNSRTTMARYLNGEWEGPLRMYFKNQAGQTVYTDYQVIWHFELSASSDVKGRGTEYRYNEDEGETRTNFSWCVNGYGGIEISYDPSQSGQEPVNMLIAYNNLDKLSTTHFKGTSVGVNIEEEDDFNLTKRLPQRVKGETTAVVAGKTFGGKKADDKTAPVERNITIKNEHR